MKPIESVILCLVLFESLAQFATAGTIGLAGFSGNENVITFESISPGTLITNQFTAAGVTFSGGLYGDPFPSSSIQGNREATNFLNVSTITNPITASFSTHFRRIGFFVAGNGIPGDQIQVRSFRQGSQLDSVIFTPQVILAGGTLPSVFAGIEQLLGIDRVEISNLTGNRAFSMDDFRFENVPEPSTMVLLCLAAFFARCGPTRPPRRRNTHDFGQPGYGSHFGRRLEAWRPWLACSLTISAGRLN